MFEFSTILSAAAKGDAKPFSGYPPFHFVGGNIDEPTVPTEALADAVGDVIRNLGHAMGKYGMDSGPQGHLPLRDIICKQLKRRAGMSVDPSEVLLTTGSLQAMDLVNKTLLNNGDVVLVEAANYAGTLTKLDALGVSYVGIELDNDGMRMDALEQALSDLTAQGRKPKYIFTIPTVQNPTGSVMPLERRLEMLALAKRYDVPIFEDDCYADLVFSGDRPPAIHALDDEHRVIYCGTFSKTIAPALRVGYLVAPWPLMGHILPLKTDAGSGALEQIVLAEFLPRNFDNHVEGLLHMLREKANTLCASLDEYFGADVEYRKPIGGIYLWVTFPKSVDTNRLYTVALGQGVEINPGALWTVEGADNKHRMRLCFGHPTNENIREGVAKLAQICFEEFGVPVRSGNVERE
ncbi:PLP-dependent aminotransferase family protein [Pseudohalocynthiibacter sp. F2068]|jgi:2-aminoadipate transaminase|uniref:aminotransferase-like domain-containing protein n=1 Tax=Pseudohalocynthiibacter sp. F2068 TaxID=2926418 RepID=UPI001FF4FEFB|nr:PLP-dependent aminotransferase family protein [Pseudohalocynthiibacter sp. F2068]MCK0104418.1 PLP-dependent aminotransferase family protein [Pseudohalocynthiibacter sp. F2068]